MEPRPLYSRPARPWGRLVWSALLLIGEAWTVVAAAAGEAETKSASSHLLRPEMSAALRASLPKYAPPPKSPAPAGGRDRPNAGSVAQGVASTDAPGVRSPDGVVHLPDYVVQGDKVPAFSHYDLLTPKGRLDLAYQLNPGLKVGPWNHLNNRYAKAMLEEERRVQRMRAGEELIHNAVAKDPKRSKELKRLWYDAYVRSREW